MNSNGLKECSFLEVKSKSKSENQTLNQRFAKELKY